MHAWTSSHADADYRGFTHLRANYRGITHPASDIIMASFTAKEALAAARPVDNCRFVCFSSIQMSGFHTPQARGITHRTIGVSHTESRGFTHRPFSESRRKAGFFAPFFRLNLLNDSYLTEYLNPPALRARIARLHAELTLRANAPWLRAGYRRHKGGLSAAGFREKPSGSDGVCLSVSAPADRAGQAISQSSALHLTGVYDHAGSNRRANSR